MRSRTRFPRWYLGAVVAAGALRLAELRHSNRNEAAAGDNAGSQAAAADYPLMVALHVGLFTLPLLEVGLRRPRPPMWLVGAAGAATAGATALRWWSIASLGEEWNVRARVPDEIRPVERGPYRYIRHPNYLAVAVEVLALPLLGGAWWSALGLTIVDSAILLRRIRAEEVLLMRSRAYRERFGPRPRFIPGLF